MTGILIERGYLDIKTCTQGDNHVKMKADGVDASISQRMLNISSESTKLGTGSSLQPLEGTNPVDALISDLYPLNYEIVCFCYCLSYLVCGTLLGQP